MVDIRGPEGKEKVREELQKILDSNLRGFAGLVIKKVSISELPKGLQVMITMISEKRQGKVFLEGKKKLFEDLMGKRVIAYKIFVTFTKNSFSEEPEETI